MPNFTYENDVYGKAPECVGCENLGKSVTQLQDELKKLQDEVDNHAASARLACDERDALQAIVDELQSTIDQTFAAIGVEDPSENDDPEVDELQDAVAVTIQFHKDEAGQMLERIGELEDEVDRLRAEVERLKGSGNTAVATVQYMTGAADGPGWYYYDDEYPEEGVVGAFKTWAEAQDHASQAYGVIVVQQLKSAPALPECVRRLRAKRSMRPASIWDDPEPPDGAEQACLEWLATAPASAIVAAAAGDVRTPVGNVTSLNDHLIDRALEAMDRRGMSHSAIADLLRGCRGYDGRNSDQIDQLCARALEEVTDER